MPENGTFEPFTTSACPAVRKRDMCASLIHCPQTLLNGLNSSAIRKFLCISEHRYVYNKHNNNKNRNKNKIIIKSISGETYKRNRGYYL